MNRRANDDYWFSGCASGCGTGRTIRWQGWLLSAVYGSIVTLAALMLAERTMVGFLAIMAVATSVFLIVCHHKTRGGLRLTMWPHPPSRRGRRP